MVQFVGSTHDLVESFVPRLSIIIARECAGLCQSVLVNVRRTWWCCGWCLECVCVGDEAPRVFECVVGFRIRVPSPESVRLGCLLWCGVCRDRCIVVVSSCNFYREACPV